MMGCEFASPYIDKLRRINPLQQSLPISCIGRPCRYASRRPSRTSSSSDEPLSSASTADGDEQITAQLMALAYVTGNAIVPDYKGVTVPADKIPVLTCQVRSTFVVQVTC